MNLEDFFKLNNKVAIAFSGGVDSAYLLYAAVKNNCDVKAYYVKSAFQPQFELDDAIKLAKELKANMQIIDVDVLANETIRSNPNNRCYYCKQVIFTTILKQAIKDGYKVLVDGTNASDDVNDRPGMKALKELEVVSPLRICNLTKSQIRELSKKAGLFTFDKPAYACLATRVKTNETITLERLSNIEKSEDFLFKLGFSDFRVRTVGSLAKIQLKKEQLNKLMENREIIVEELKKYFKEVVLDLEVRG